MSFFENISAAVKISSRLLLKNRIPGQLVIQYTDQCNASCPQCGMRISNKFERATLDKARVKKIIRSAADKGISALSFTGGEPFLYLDQICQLATYAGQHGIKYIRTGTNGFMFRNSADANFNDRIKRLADQLAATPIRNIWVSIDSAEIATHEQMRGLPGVVRGIEKALPIFAERGLFLSANLGLNRNFAGSSNAHDNLEYADFYQGFDCFYRFVHDLGFTIANVCYPMHSDDPAQSADVAVYAATASDRVVYFSTQEKINLFRALSDVIPNHRDKLRIFTPRSSIHTLLQQYQGRPELATACRGGIDYFFIASKNGMTYPCGYRGAENLGDFCQLDLAGKASKGDCRQCDWECFRDPSELFAPLLDLRQSPLQLAKHLLRDRTFFKLWFEDLLYYRACHYFNGRIAPNSHRLENWYHPVQAPSATHI